MKRIEIKVIAGFVLLLFFSMNSFAQTTITTSKNNKIKADKLEKNKVPKEVMEAYSREYPVSPFPNWYGYPAVNDEDWYYSDRYLYKHDEYPESYVVEFMKDNIPYSAVYAKSGKKLAVHKKLISELPKAVKAAISNSEYKTWKLGTEKEEIFRDKDSDKLKIYKVEVEKGKEKHTIFFQIDGKIVKDKKVS